MPHPDVDNSGLRYEQVSRNEINVYIGDDLIGRLKRVRWSLRSSPKPFYFHPVSLMAPLSDDVLCREFRQFQATPLGTNWEAAGDKALEWIRAHGDLLLSAIFRDIPSRRVSDLLEAAEPSAGVPSFGSR